jgi:hypothetical protein
MLRFLPLEVLVVRENRFRVPKRSVDETGGTKALLLWLRNRVVAED